MSETLFSFSFFYSSRARLLFSSNCPLVNSFSQILLGVGYSGTDGAATQVLAAEFTQTRIHRPAIHRAVIVRKGGSDAHIAHA